MCRGISGLRVGWMHTLNADLIGAMDSLAYFAMPSTIIQEAATQMLRDRAFVAFYLQENQRRLARSYDALIGAVTVPCARHARQCICASFVAGCTGSPPSALVQDLHMKVCPDWGQLCTCQKCQCRCTAFTWCLGCAIIRRPSHCLSQQDLKTVDRSNRGKSGQTMLCR